MAKIFAILTALVLAVSAFLAYQNMGNEDEEFRGYRGWIAARQNEEASLERNEKKLTDTTGELNKTDSQLTEVNGKNEALQVAVDELIASNQALEKQKAEKEKLAEEQKEAVEAAREDFANFGDVEQAISDLKKTQASLASLELEISEKNAQRNALEQTKAKTQSSIDAVREQIRYRVTQESSPTLRTSVAGVYPNLGFVTLAAGDNLGVVKESTLDVVRGGQVVGKLLVTTVEARTAAADIVPDSFADGESVRSGDTVVPGAKPKKPKKPKATATVPVPAKPKPIVPINPDPEG